MAQPAGCCWGGQQEWQWAGLGLLAQLMERVNNGWETAAPAPAGQHSRATRHLLPDLGIKLQWMMKYVNGRKVFFRLPEPFAQVSKGQTEGWKDRRKAGRMKEKKDTVEKSEPGNRLTSGWRLACF